MIALMLDVANLRVLVFGNGTVGTRKAQYFRDEAAEVTILDTADTATADLDVLVSGYDIIIAATNDPAFNDTVSAIAGRQHKWYNSATGRGNFLIPAAFQEGDVSIAISTNGKAPATAAYIRTKLETECPALPNMVTLQDKLRTALKQRDMPQEQRAAILRAVLDDQDIWTALEDSEIFEAEKLAWRHV